MDEAHENFNRTASRSVAAGGGCFSAGGLEFSVLSCQYNELPPGFRVPEHEHPYYCLSFVERSSMRTSCDGVTVENRAGKRTLFFMPPTTIASIYGMNFEFIPGSHQKLGFFLALILMIVVSLLTYAYFKWKKWL